MNYGNVSVQKAFRNNYTIKTAKLHSSDFEETTSVTYLKQQASDNYYGHRGHVLTDFKVTSSAAGVHVMASPCTVRYSVHHILYLILTTKVNIGGLRMVYVEKNIFALVQDTLFRNVLNTTSKITQAIGTRAFRVK